MNRISTDTLKALSHECRINQRMRNECLFFFLHPLISVSCPFNPLNGRSSLGYVRCLCHCYFSHLSTSFVNVIRFSCVDHIFFIYFCCCYFLRCKRHSFLIRLMSFVPHTLAYATLV